MKYRILVKMKSSGESWYVLDIDGTITPFVDQAMLFRSLESCRDTILRIRTCPWLKDLFYRILVEPYGLLESFDPFEEGRRCTECEW